MPYSVAHWHAPVTLLELRCFVSVQNLNDTSYPVFLPSLQKRMIYEFFATLLAKWLEYK
jgi:hypothetical protein